MKHHLPLFALFVTSLAACAGSSRATPYAYTTRSTSRPAGPVSFGGYDQGGPSSAQAPSPAAPVSVYGRAESVQSESSVSGDSDGAPESGGVVNVAPTERPGLATEWGESRRSTMSYSPFVRASSSPIDVAAIHYNDRHLAAMQAMQHSARPASWIGIRNDGVRVSLRDEGGDALPGFFAGDTVYVLGSSGQRYTVLIENTTPYRFETVVSVDGLDVINGQPASGAQRGYILPAYGRVEIEGFRQSQSTVASFRFGSVGDSYAAQTGDARNVGVIGVALYVERGAPVDLEQNEVELRERANPFPGGFAPPPQTRRYYY